MNRSILLLLFLLLNVLAYSQNNVLILQKHGKTKRSYFAGNYIRLQTKQGNYADGMITKIFHDTIYIRHFDIEKTFTAYGGILFDTAFRYTTSIHYKDIGALLSSTTHPARRKNGTLLLIAGGGVLALGAINGLYRHDKPRDWYKPSGYIVAGTLTGLGTLMKLSSDPKSTIGKKYQLNIVPLDRR